jgi:hypothetical protein
MNGRLALYCVFCINLCLLMSSKNSLIDGRNLLDAKCMSRNEVDHFPIVGALHAWIYAWGRYIGLWPM